MRHVQSGCLLVVLGVLGTLRAQDCTAPVISCGADFSMGAPGIYEDSVTDLTYRAAQQEVWAIEGPRPGYNSLSATRLTVFKEDFKTGRRSFSVRFPESAFGIADIPTPRPFAGNFYVVSPGVFPGPGLFNPDPQIGIMDDGGNIISDLQGVFTRVEDPNTGQSPPGFLSAIDLHPADDELAVLDDGNAGGGQHILFLDLQYKVKRGPFPILGAKNYFGGGITYNTPNTVLVVAQFGNLFESRVAMEYDRMTGIYTGRSVVLDPVGGGGLVPPLALGVDTGTVNGAAALFLYNAQTDAGYALSLEAGGYVDAPGPIQSPQCGLDAEGRVHFIWSNDPDFSYDQIAILENSVQVAVLAPDAVEYVSPNPSFGKFLFCVETRVAGSPSPVRICCEGENPEQLPFLPPNELPGKRVQVDPAGQSYHYQIGVASTPVVEKKEDFRLYIIGSYDNQVRVVDYKKDLIPGETIATQPLRQSIVQGNAVRDFAATGIALIEVTVQGQKVPMYALLDGDGPQRNFNPRASIHYLRNTTLPGNPTPVPAGTAFQDLIDLDFTGVQEMGTLILDWDTDAAGDLLALDSEGRRLLKFHYNSEDRTIKAVKEVPLPLVGLTPFAGILAPMGQVSVLPSGYYLVTGGDTFDSTVTRAFLMTPMTDDPATSGQLVGYVDGLVTFSEFFSNLGLELGPDVSWGLETVFFSKEGANADGAGAMFYTLQNYFPTNRLYASGNFLVALTSKVCRPDLAAEPLVDETQVVTSRSTLDTDVLTPSFAASPAAIDYHYHVFNPSLQEELQVKIKVLLDGVEVPSLTESQLSLPAGRSLYRRAENRAEKTIRVLVENAGPAQRSIRVLVGATGLKSSVASPLFRRGDANDDSLVDLSDAIAILQHLFLGGVKPVCLDAADADDSGVYDLSDPIFLLNMLFLSGPTLPNPGPNRCGPDPTADTLDPCVPTSC